jgi:hypothetical protein
MVVHNGIITNYKDIKALLVSVILSLVRKDLDVHGHDSFENLEGDSSGHLQLIFFIFAFQEGMYRKNL